MGEVFLKDPPSQIFKPDNMSLPGRGKGTTFQHLHTAANNWSDDSNVQMTHSSFCISPTTETAWELVNSSPSSGFLSDATVFRNTILCLVDR